MWLFVEVTSSSRVAAQAENKVRGPFLAVINDSDGRNETCEGLLRLAARYELESLVVAGVFTHVQLVSVVSYWATKILTPLSFAWIWKRPTVLGDERHRGFGHGPALRDGGAHHGDDGSFKFEKECDTRSQCVSVEQPSRDDHLLRHAVF